VKQSSKWKKKNEVYTIVECIYYSSIVLTCLLRWHLANAYWKTAWILPSFAHFVTIFNPNSLLSCAVQFWLELKACK
jgi:hypothetical protein